MRVNAPPRREPTGLEDQLRRWFGSSRDRLTDELAEIVDVPGRGHRVRRLNALIAEIDRMQARLPELARDWARVAFPEQYGFGADVAASRVGAEFGWTQFHRQAAGVLVTDTYDDVLRSTRYETRAVKSFVRTLGQEAVWRQIVEGRTPQQAARDLARAFRERGLDGITYRNGRTVSLRTYTEMLMRTKSALSYNFGTLQMLRSVGQNSVQIIDGTGCGLTSHFDPVAADGLVLSLTDAWAFPISHPNCVRDFVPVSQAPTYDPSDEQRAMANASLEDARDSAKPSREGSRRNARVPRSERTARNERSARTPRGEQTRAERTVLDGQVRVRDHVDLEVRDLGTHVSVDLLRVSQAQRGQGLATATMRDLTEWADRNGRVLSLTPQKIGTSGLSQRELEAFYRRWGFGKKRRSDFEISESWARYPDRQRS